MELQEEEGGIIARTASGREVKRGGWRIGRVGAVGVGVAAGLCVMIWGWEWEHFNLEYGFFL